MSPFDLSTLLQDGPILYCMYCVFDILVPKEKVYLYVLAVSLAVFLLDDRPTVQARQTARPALMEMLSNDFNLRIGQANQKQLCEQYLHAYDLALSKISAFFLGRSDLKNLVRITLKPSNVVQVLVRLDDERIVSQPMPVQYRTNGGTFEVLLNLETEGQGHCLVYNALHRNGRTLSGRVLIDNLYFMPRIGHDDNVQAIDEVYYQYFN